MRITYAILTDCSGVSPQACSDACLAALGHGPTLKLKASGLNDHAHGAVSIVHPSDPDEPHLIQVEIYEADEGRKRKPPVIPKADEIHLALAELSTDGRAAQVTDTLPLPTGRADA